MPYVTHLLSNGLARRRPRSSWNRPPSWSQPPGLGGRAPSRRAAAVALAATLIGPIVMIGLVAPAVAAPVAAEAAAAADRPVPQINVVLDLSGSMKEPDSAGKPRIDVARTAVHSVVSALPDDAQLGLRTFGDCGKSDQVVPVSRLDRDRTNTAVDSLPPRGDTPLAYALEQAARDFPAGDQQKTLLLVSDGQETCGGDPVAAIKKISAMCVGTHVDVVGFQVDAATKAQLTQIATAGCGQYLDVTQAGDLSDLLKRAALRATRPVRTVGEPVTGSATREQAPTITSGVYRDVLPAGRKVERFWAFQMPAGATVHASVTSPGTAVASWQQDGYELIVLDQDRHWCGSAFSNRMTGESATTLVASMPAVPIGARDKDCKSPGRWYLSVANGGDPPNREVPVPIEISLVVEAPVGSSATLPPAAATLPRGQRPEQPPAVTVTGPARPVAASATLGEAPIVGTGVYSDSLRRGEEAYYRVPVGWGQRLVARLRLGEAASQTKTRLTEQMGVASNISIRTPMLLGASGYGSQSDAQYLGSALSQTVATAPVRYRNRDLALASDDWQNVPVRSTYLAGYYYVTFHLKPGTSENLIEVPFELDIQVAGGVEGGPGYQRVAGAVDPVEFFGLNNPGRAPKQLAGKGRQRSSPAVPLAVAAGGAVVLVVALAVVVVPRLRRRRAG